MLGAGFGELVQTPAGLNEASAVPGCCFLTGRKEMMVALTEMSAPVLEPDGVELALPSSLPFFFAYC